MQGKVHNPSGEGVNAISSQVKKKTAKLTNGSNNSVVEDKDKVHKVSEHETQVKETGSSRRNITRKKGGNENIHDSKKKKQGGAG